MLAVILVEPSGPLNVGLVARACANFDAELRLVNPKARIDDQQCRMMAAHALDYLQGAGVYASLAEAVSDLTAIVGTSAKRRDRGRGIFLKSQELGDWLGERGDRWGLVFGSEAKGLRTSDLAHCQTILNLQTFGPQPSFNLSHAVALACEAARRSQEEPRALRGESLTAGRREALLSRYFALMGKLGYSPGLDQDRLAVRLGAMVDRWNMSPSDADSVHGFLAQVEKALGGIDEQHKEETHE